MTNKFALHVETFQYWYDNFEAVSFDVEDEGRDEIKILLHKLINAKDIDQKEIELLYMLALDNTIGQKSDFIKFQAKKIVNFLNSGILQNIIKE